MSVLNLKKRTASSFGFEWSKFSDIYAEYELNFLETISPLMLESLKGKLVLDAGCGAGRNSYFMAKAGADVIACDLSEKAVQSAIRNLEGLPNVAVMQADICDLPNDWQGMFDYIFSIGVLHHLPDPQEGFNKLVKCLKSGGAISIWVYGRKDNKMALYLYEPLRRVTIIIPHSILYCLAFIPAVMVEIVNKLKLPIFSHYKRFPFRTKWNDAFDMMSAPSAKYYTIEDIEKWYDDAGLDGVIVSYRLMNGVAKGIRGLGVKP